MEGVYYGRGTPCTRLGPGSRRRFFPPSFPAFCLPPSLPPSLLPSFPPSLPPSPPPLAQKGALGLGVYCVKSLRSSYTGFYDEDDRSDFTHGVVSPEDRACGAKDTCRVVFDFLFAPTSTTLIFRYQKESIEPHEATSDPPPTTILEIANGVNLRRIFSFTRSKTSCPVQLPHRCQTYFEYRSEPIRYKRAFATDQRQHAPHVFPSVKAW